MKLFYYHSTNNNFGDAINPWFWKQFLNMDFNEWTRNETNSLDIDVLVGVGTLINDLLPKANNLHIFGTGAGYGNLIPKAKKNWIIHCVRGPLTAKLLGIDSNLAISDPIILLNKLIELETNKDIKCSFMPHIGIDSGRYQRICEDIGITYISPKWDKDKVIQLVNRSEKLICSAMHGAILAEALLVPWYPVITSFEILDFKWKDWCYSLDLEYNPSKLPAIWRDIEKNTFSQFKGTIKNYLVQKEITRIVQKGEFILSKDIVFNNRISRLEEVIDKFNSSYIS